MYKCMCNNKINIKIHVSGRRRRINDVDAYPKACPKYQGR